VPYPNHSSIPDVRPSADVSPYRAFQTSAAPVRSVFFWIALQATSSRRLQDDKARQAPDEPHGPAHARHQGRGSHRHGDSPSTVLRPADFYGWHGYKKKHPPPSIGMEHFPARIAAKFCHDLQGAKRKSKALDLCPARKLAEGLRACAAEAFSSAMVAAYIGRGEVRQTRR